MKVFLGGTSTGLKWRDSLQPLLKCDYYNPIVKEWTEADRLREVHERETCDYVLYGITNSISGVYSIAEVVDDSNKRPEKTLFLNMYNLDKEFPHLREYRQMAKSLKAVEKLLVDNGVRVFRSIDEVVKFLNRAEREWGIKMKNYYKSRAIQYAEKYGIVEYKVDGKKMVYYANYPPAGLDPRQTYKVTVNLDTLKEESRVGLKRWNSKGNYNMYK